MKKFKSLGTEIKKIESIFSDIENLPDDKEDRCPHCDGYGNILDENGARMCSCVQQEEIVVNFEQARIPKRFTKETLDTFIPISSQSKAVLQKAKTYVNNYDKENSMGMYIYGPTGSGKTHLVVGILKELLQKGYSGVFYNIVDLLDAIRSTYDPQSLGQIKTQLESDLNKQIFILDDFGVQRTSPWVADRLYALINRRYQDCKTLIVTSNINMHDLELKVDKRLSSRIIGMCEEIEIKADDYRQRTRASVSYNKSRRYPKS